MKPVRIAAIALFISLNGAAAQAPSSTADFALRIAAAADSAAARVDWPGFSPAHIPFALYDGEQTWLFAHPAVPAGFTQFTNNVSRYDGRHPAITANSSAQIGGVATATVIVNPKLNHSPSHWAGVVLHEKFHVHQRARHPAWAANEVTLFTYPFEVAGLLALRRLESVALRNALLAPSASATRCWAVTALSLRNARLAQLDSAEVAYERTSELNEGLPEYIQHVVTGGALAEVMPEQEFAAAALRDRVYASGLAIALLLDRLAPGWSGELVADPGASLDGMLKAQVGTSATEECEIPDEARRAAERRATTDIAALRASRIAELEEFSDSTGWRIVIESAAPLWPQGFDPLNVEVLAPGKVVHRRYLKLGNDAGSVEVLDAKALTESAGDHPLFNGVKRIVIRTPRSLQVNVAGDTTTITAEGVTATFRNASLIQTGKTLRLLTTND